MKKTINRLARPYYLIVILLIALFTLSGAIIQTTIHPAQAKAADATPSLRGEEALSYLQSEGLLSSLQAEFRKLTDTDGAAFDQFGASVSISGNTVVIGSPRDQAGANQLQGSACIFERNLGGADGWGRTVKLTATDGAADDHFGLSVAIDGDVVLVSAPLDRVGNNIEQGSVYIFERNAGGSGKWGEVKKLVASDGAAFDQFGHSVAISGNTIIVGVPLDRVGENIFQGSVYIFERDAGGENNWGEVKQLLASEGAAGDRFGNSVAISQDTIVVGAPFGGVGINSFPGSAYIFERNTRGEVWGEVKQLTASDGQESDFFGHSVAISGKTVIVGAPFHAIGSNKRQGSAYIFERTAGIGDVWGETRKLDALDGEAGDLFGASVSISGDIALVGAHSDDVEDNSEQGSAYIFSRNTGGSGNWGEVRKLTASDGAANDEFGISASISGDTLVVSAFRDDVAESSDQGSAYIFLANNAPAPTYDFCLQDDSVRNRQLFLNSQTGKYLFCDGSVNIGGSGLIAHKGSTSTLTHSSTDRRLFASVTVSRFGPSKGSASLQLVAAKRTYTINNSNIAKNSCSCGK